LKFEEEIWRADPQEVLHGLDEEGQEAYRNCGTHESTEGLPQQTKEAVNEAMSDD
jgi:hypothetical protein